VSLSGRGESVPHLPEPAMGGGAADGLSCGGTGWKVATWVWGGSG